MRNGTFSLHDVANKNYSKRGFMNTPTVLCTKCYSRVCIFLFEAPPSPFSSPTKDVFVCFELWYYILKQSITMQCITPSDTLCRLLCKFLSECSLLYNSFWTQHNASHTQPAVSYFNTMYCRMEQKYSPLAGGVNRNVLVMGKSQI